jgi:hypothetical protein
VLRPFVRIGILTVALFCLPRPLVASPITVDFESLNDLESVNSQFAGLTFFGATNLTAGLSLNEFDYPPRSGSNVVFDDGGSMSIFFATDVYSFAGYFTYAAPLTLTAFDASNNVLGFVSSIFASNFVSSGTLGSSPNELMQFQSLLGIASVTITGDPLGGSFVLDDLTYDNEPATVPDPATPAVMLLGALSLMGFQLRANRQR